MATKTPRILYLTSNCPHAASYGSQIRALSIGKLLQACGQVRMVLLERGTSFSREEVAKTRNDFDLEMVMKLSPTGIKGIRERLGHEFDPSVLNTHGSRPDEEQVARLRELVGEHDVIWLHNLFSANHAGLRAWPRAILDVDDVLTQYYRSTLKNAKSWAERAIALRQFFLWKRREAVLLKRFSLLAVCSDADRKYLGADKRIHTIPNGYGMTASEPIRSVACPTRVGFIGTLEYAPNREGVEWFIRQVWPKIKRAHPLARLRLVGSGTDAGMSELGSDIDGLGRVEDASAEIASWAVGIVPIRIGGGTRIKIAEGFSRKCPLVSTSWGAFGYEVVSGAEILLADEPNAFADACGFILRDANYGQQIAESAFEKYVKCWTWAAIQPRVEAAVQHCLSLAQANGTSRTCPILPAITKLTERVTNAGNCR